jgi:hypothetical protein
MARQRNCEAKRQWACEAVRPSDSKHYENKAVGWWDSGMDKALIANQWDNKPVGQ